LNLLQFSHRQLLVHLFGNQPRDVTPMAEGVEVTAQVVQIHGQAQLLHEGILHRLGILKQQMSLFYLLSFTFVFLH